MNVYVVTAVMDYEYEIIEGVFTTLEAAMRGEDGFIERVTVAPESRRWSKRLSKDDCHRLRTNDDEICIYEMELRDA